MIRTIHIINGPNLNLLGKREIALYGSIPFETYFVELKKDYPQVRLEYFQSNHEGALLDYLHAHGFEKNTGMLLNAGGLTHTSVALRDAVSAIETPVVEIHLTDIYKREPFRWHSFLTDVCAARYLGHGLEGYRKGIDFLLQR